MTEERRPSDSDFPVGRGIEWVLYCASADPGHAAFFAYVQTIVSVSGTGETSLVVHPQRLATGTLQTSFRVEGVRFRPQYALDLMTWDTLDSVLLVEIRPYGVQTLRPKRFTMAAVERALAADTHSLPEPE